MHRTLPGVLTLLALAVLTPVALAAVAGTGVPATVWSTVAVTTGAQACVTLVLTLVAAARVRWVTGRLGIDGAMSLHRTLGSATAALAAAHLLAVIADNPGNIWLVDPSVAPARAVAGTVALVVLALLVGFAERRARRYEWWRWAHRVGGVAALGLVGLHLWWLNRLIREGPWTALFAVGAVVAATAGVWRWAAPGRRHRLIVADLREETPTVSTVTLRPCGGPLAFTAGQFAWLRVRKWPWAEDHPFTISSAADGSGTVEFTFRHVGDWTRGPLRRLRPGAVVWIDGPHGGMTLAAAADAPGLVMICAGVGLTPAMSVLRTVAGRGDFRPMLVITPPGEPLFRGELLALRKRLYLTVEDTLPRPVTPESLETCLPDRAWIPLAAYYVCGPPGMVEGACDALRELGIPAERIHSEQFEIA